jgi:hypothetical protein
MSYEEDTCVNEVYARQPTNGLSMCLSLYVHVNTCVYG